MIRIYIFIIFVFAIIRLAMGQECDNPVQVCYNNPVNNLSNENAPAGSNTFCFPPDNSVYFSITSNNLGGELTVTIDNINCSEINTGGIDLFQGLEAVLFEMDPNFTCNEFSYVPLHCSESSDSEIVLESVVSPSTEYFVMIDGANDPGGVLDPGECEFDIDVNGIAIENSFTAGQDFTIELGDEVILQASGYGDTLNWSPVSGLFSAPQEGNPTARPSVTTDYVITTIIDACTVSDTMTVEVIPFVEPFNAFTPNEDGINDTWEIPNIIRFPKVEISVYSRWGQQVFRSIGYTIPWDGSINGNRLPAATYYYIINLNHDSLNDEKNLVTGTLAIVY